MSLRDHSFAHTGLKVVSVALAVLLWMMVSSQRASVERGLRIPLELQNLPENLEMVEPPQESVDVRVRGTADALGRIAPGDLVATVDLSAAQSGRRLFHLSPERVKAPFAVAVTQVTPSSVAIRFEPSATRIVPVMPSVEGEPAPGFIVGKISADPPDGGDRRARKPPAARDGSDYRAAVGRIGERRCAFERHCRRRRRRRAPEDARRPLSYRSRSCPRRKSGSCRRVAVRARNLAAGLRATIAPPLVKVRVRGTKEATRRSEMRRSSPTSTSKASAAATTDFRSDWSRPPGSASINWIPLL